MINSQHLMARLTLLLPLVLISQVAGGGDLLSADKQATDFAGCEAVLGVCVDQKEDGYVARFVEVARTDDICLLRLLAMTSEYVSQAISVGSSNYPLHLQNGNSSDAIGNWETDPEVLRSVTNEALFGFVSVYSDELVRDGMTSGTLKLENDVLINAKEYKTVVAVRSTERSGYAIYVRNSSKLRLKLDADRDIFLNKPVAKYIDIFFHSEPEDFIVHVKERMIEKGAILKFFEPSEKTEGEKVWVTCVLIVDSGQH